MNDPQDYVDPPECPVCGQEMEMEPVVDRDDRGILRCWGVSVCCANKECPEYGNAN